MSIEKENIPLAERFDLFTRDFIKEKSRKAVASLGLDVTRAKDISLHSIFSSEKSIQQFFSNSMVREYLSRPASEVEFLESGLPKKSVLYEDDVYNALHKNKITIPYRSSDAQKNFYVSGIGVENIRVIYDNFAEELSSINNSKADIHFIPELTSIEDIGLCLRHLQKDCRASFKSKSFLDAESAFEASKTKSTNIFAFPATRSQSGFAHIFPVIAIYDNNRQHFNAVYYLDSVPKTSLEKKTGYIKDSLLASDFSTKKEPYDYTIAKPIGLDFQTISTDQNCSIYTIKIISAAAEFLFNGNNLEKFSNGRFASSNEAQAQMEHGVKENMKNFFKKENDQFIFDSKSIKDEILKFRWEIGNTQLNRLFEQLDKNQEKPLSREL
jgi:hypothetical protein